MSNPFELDDEIQRCCPYDGPHTNDTLSAAARGIAALVRYLNNATQRPGSSQLAWAATSYRVLGGVSAGVHGLNQLLGQIDAAMASQANNRTLYDDRRDRPGADTAKEVRAHLSAAHELICRAAASLGEAHSASSHLGNDD